MSSHWKIHTENFPGNLHQTASTINKMGWAEFLITMSSNGSGTVAVFRMHHQLVTKIRLKNCSYVGDPNHDDFKGDE